MGSKILISHPVKVIELDNSKIETIKMFINDHYGWTYDGKCLLQLIEYYEKKIEKLNKKK